MNSLQLDSKTTALVLIDLQNWIFSRELSPYSAQDVIQRSRQLVEAFRKKAAPVIFLTVDLGNMTPLVVDTPSRDPNAPPPPPTALELSPDSGYMPDDLVLTKRHWGAFTGTELERVLTAHGIQTVVLCGVATNFGVESTARQGTGLGFSFVIAEDACTGGLGPEDHRFAMEKIFPRIARVRKTEDVIASLG
jgi:nicotinamidase-related amidase